MTNGRNTLLTNFNLIRGKFSISPSKGLRKCFSELYHPFAVCFFNNKIGQKLFTKVQKSVTCDNPFKAGSFEKMVSSFFECSATSSSESILKPVKYSFIGIRYLKNASVVSVFIPISRLIFKFAGVKTSFTVYEPRKIGQVKRGVNCRDVFYSMFVINIVKFCHVRPNFHVFSR